MILYINNIGSSGYFIEGDVFISDNSEDMINIFENEKTYESIHYMDYYEVIV